MQTERVTFLTSPDHKAALDAFAASNGQSLGHVLREASTRYIADREKDEEAELAILVEELKAALPQMRVDLQQSIAAVAKARAEIARYRREAGFIA